MVDMPYFMTNSKWYYYDYKEAVYKLTSEAPEKAKSSYESFYSQVYGGWKNERFNN